MSKISLSLGVRQNLLALQETSTLLSSTQNKLATGLKVNSAIDNPNSYFTAFNLNNRADDMLNLLNNMGQGVQTLKAANAGISSITKLVEAVDAVVNEALKSTDLEKRRDLAAQFNELLGEMGNIAKDSGYDASNLLTGDDLTVTFNEKSNSDKNSLTIKGVNYSSAYQLGITTAGGWGIYSSIERASEEVTNVLSKLRNQAKTYGTALTVVENRQNFTKQMIDTLKEGAGKLNLVDSNKEGAKLLSLQTRQSLSSTALSMASQVDQNVLRIF